MSVGQGYAWRGGVFHKTIGVWACSGGNPVPVRYAWTYVPGRTSTRPQIKYGARGADVYILQELLKSAGFNPGTIDGIFGSGTRTAVRNFQASAGLTVDGIVGSGTWAGLGDGPWAQWWPHAGSTTSAGTTTTGTTTTGTVHVTTHTTTTTATIVHGIASWYVPSGRTVISQTLTYYTGLSTNPQKHTISVSASSRHKSVLAAGWNAKVRYTYR